ncbi:alpha-amylase [Cohnella sp. 56]|uniref:alpha-amylase n=1 Tax=Cohnella sp. 56 TaxID=3113722 RepID=UPI0030EAB1DC
MERNHTMMQFFEWHVTADGKHWRRLAKLAPKLKDRGIDAVWIPPPAKAVSPEDTGYAVYDLYDLGEFDQKGSVRTKYGTKEELLEAIAACRESGVGIYADLVMNHKAGADGTETFQVVEVKADNRLEDISEPFDIEGWTKFDFPGRGDRYSSFKWNYEHFNGTDCDARADRQGIYRIVGEGKRWNENVDDAFGNYDYLMYANIDYHHPDVRREMIEWGKWLADTLGCAGYRLDAIKHIDHTFVREFTDTIYAERGDEFFIVGEFWNSDPGACQQFLEHVGGRISLFDVRLHYNLHEASEKGADYDLTKLFDDTLVQTNPQNAVTFVDNHDSQPGEALESWIADWFKQSAYALILLREGGYPCVFYGDYFHIGGDAEEIEGKKLAIDPLLYSRHHKAYGEQEDYFDDPRLIGWVRRGTDEIARSGCAVVVCTGEGGEKKMFVGEHRAGEEWVDFTRTLDDKVVIGEDGCGVFPVGGGSVSVWALPDPD